MKIAFASATEQSPLGGAEISTGLLRSELEKKSICVKLLSLDRGRKTSDQNTYLVPISWIPTKIIYMGCGLVDFIISFYVQQFLKKNKVDLIHIHDVHILPGAINVAVKLKIPTVVTVRDNIPRIPVFSNNLIYKKIATIVYVHRSHAIKKALLKSDRIIAISKYIKRNLIELGIPEEKIDVIYNVPPDWTCENVPEEKLIFSAGRLKEEKGFEILIRAFALAKKELPEYKLVIAGEGPDYKRLKNLIRQFDIAVQVQLIGKLNYEQMKIFYCRSGLVVMPSLYPEPLGRILIEAMSVGKPTIAASCGGMVELVEDGFNGITYPATDYVALSKALITILKNKETMVEFGLNGKKLLSKKLNEKQIIEKTLTIYNNVIGGKKHG